MSGQERAVVGVIGAVVLLLFVALFWPKDNPPPTRQKSDVTSQPEPLKEAPPAPRDEPRPPPTRRPDSVQAEPRASAIPPETTTSQNPNELPPLTGLILTFPPDMSEGEMDEKMAKCKAVVSRRRGVYVKVNPGPGSSYNAIKSCFQYSEVSVQEERGAPPTP